MKFNIIYADPAWLFEVWNRDTGNGRSAESHYRTMTLQGLKDLPVKDLAAPDCVLFLWACMPMLPEALEVIEAWGFTYKTVAFTWAKRCRADRLKWFFGMGYWTRANCELCLLATRGKPKRVDASVRQLVEAAVGAHSAKPPEVRDRIVQLIGDLPRVELFARETAPGWTALGNEIDGKDLRESLPELARATSGKPAPALPLDAAA